ncbi:M20/M25/M40 family metallo-hydrolase [Rhodohalobacter sulfatireducens]|uniref:M20/M25/M40 family metallo-hydrolase n=1 Tax=Rhodohalobacter sulfatireducens TaxID=2911366 RepID=A0ABS9KET7_9BACT|nr:M20/M25/M40 family metallo-hydrolase [Rhodohalobacter sulfatireducens]MCG2589335.1 M20/M25/M40 family metallo-hydrolase [Rhodohalobacter sulfatireducens]
MFRFLSLIFFLLFTPSLIFAQSTAVQATREYRSQHAHSILETHFELIRIPNVACDLPNIRRNAGAIMTEFEKRGANMELLTLPDQPEVPPVIYGEINTPGADRTLIIYVHYDGQPADPVNWTHSPWEPTLYSASMEDGGEPIEFPKVDEPINPDWRIYGRSASDDKAPFAAILATLDALQQNDLELTSNLKFFFDGEEERGSPHVRQILQQYKEMLDGDLWLFFDGPMHQSGRPQVVFGVRGVTGMEVTVYGPSRPLHSGHYGGWSPVPGQMLANLLASMKNETGEILIEDFNESTAPITEADRQAFATLPDVDDEIREDLGLTWTEHEGRSLIESYMYPTLTIRGFSSGNTGELARNVIPTTATASLGIRLAKGNQPGEMKDKLEAHIREQGYHIVREDPDMETRLKHRKIAKVTRGIGYPAMRTSVDNAMTQQIVDAIKQATSDDLILYPTMGGTLPIYHFEQIMQKPIVIVPIANHDNNQHAPDENIRIGNIWYGMDIYSSIFTME